MLLIFFYTPKKHRFLIFSGGIERDPGMKWVNKFVSQHTEETNQIKLKKIRFRNSKSGSYLGKITSRKRVCIQNRKCPNRDIKFSKSRNNW